MDDLLDTLMRNKKLTIEQMVELLLGYAEDSDRFKKQLAPIDTGIHVAHAVKSGTCFPYLAAMLLDDKAVAFMVDEGELSNYPDDEFGSDVEHCSSLKYLTEDPCFYFDNKPRLAVQEPRLEALSYRERIMEFSPSNSFPLRCIVNVSPYGLQSEALSLPDPLDCDGNKILMAWFEDLVKKEAPFQLEAGHYTRFKSFFKVPGLQIYYPIHNFGNTEEKSGHDLKQFQEYFAEKVEPKLGEILNLQE